MAEPYQVAQETCKRLTSIFLVINHECSPAFSALTPGDGNTHYTGICPGESGLCSPDIVPGSALHVKNVWRFTNLCGHILDVLAEILGGFIVRAFRRSPTCQ